MLIEKTCGYLEEQKTVQNTNNLVYIIKKSIY